MFYSIFATQRKLYHRVCICEEEGKKREDHREENVTRIYEINEEIYKAALQAFRAKEDCNGGEKE